MKVRLVSLVLLIWLSAPLLSTSVAMMVLPVDLDQLVVDADRIFLGLVTAVDEQNDEHGIPGTYVTVQIARTLKGNTPTTLTFKQLGGQARPGGNALLRIAGLPTYQVGQELILFLRPTSAAGFTSPVGMEQGKFRVVRNGTKAQVLNKLGNANVLGLLGGGDDQQTLIAPEQGALHDHALDLDSFLSVIEELVNRP
jgi:hypothetical protein